MGMLYRLELENFKSYKGKHVIPFNYPFTAVIGPNGCGKSNLMDAISFVFGEKTQSLRVKTVKGLIHGAPIGKPVASSAYVKAVYREKSDAETEFMRRIQGSSTEYRINDKVVTAEAYTKKLEALGILIKAKNFLVFQNTVESIAMKTPKERTQMFEKVSRSGELAAEYEKKKIEMQKAEEDTTFNYHKKKGIAAEKKEAKAEKDEAEKYQKLKKELADGQLEMKLFNLYHNEQHINNLTSELRSKNKDLDKLLNKRSSIEDQLKSKKQEAAKMSRELAVLEKNLKIKEEDLNKKRPMFIKAKEKTSHVIKRLEATKKSHGKAKENHKRHQAEIEELQNELDEVRRAASNYEEEVAEESQGQDLELMDSQLKEYNSLKEQAGKESATIKQELDRILREQNADQEGLDHEQQKKTEFTSRHKQLDETRNQLIQRVEKLEDYIRTNVKTVGKLKEECEVLANEINEANQRHSEITQHLEEVQLELNEAKVDKHESARNQKRSEILDSMKRLYPGVYGRLIDLCEPSHKRYTLAVTKVLGRNMDSVVVDTEKTGKDCIQFIKEQHGDPQTFIPLDTIQVKPINERLRQIGGSAKLVIDVIKYDLAEIKRALQYACGSALVCDTMDEARKLAFHGSERRKTVAIDGTLFQKSGVISGGSSELRAKARRWDQKQVDSLKRKRESFLTELKDLTKPRRKEPELQNLRSQIDGLETRLRYSKRDKDTTEQQTLAENKRERELIERKLKDVEPQIANLKESLSEREEVIKETESRMNTVEDTVFAEFCEAIGVDNIRQYEEKQLKAQQERAQRRLEFANQESRLKNQLDYEKSRDTKGVMKKLQESMNNDEKEIVRLKEDEKAKLKVIDKDTSELVKFRTEIQCTRSQIDEKDLEMKEVKKALNVHTKEVTTLQKQVTSKETQLEQKKAERHSIFLSCKMEDIKLPFKKGSMDDIELEESGKDKRDQEDDSMDTSESSSQPLSESAMDTGESGSSQAAQRMYDKEAKKIVVDYRKLDKDYKELTETTEIKNTLNEITSKVNKLDSTLQRIQAPNMKAIEKLEGALSRFQETSDEFEQTRKRARKAKFDFEAIKKKRYDRFIEAFEHVSNKIDEIYKELANNPSAQAFLGPENAEEPYLDGINYNCVAPGKRFRPMDNLSGGEKTMAALALLFAMRSFQPAPFFVLDEIDAALDNTNIDMVAGYIRNQTTSHFQCIVISLKEEFYTRADALIGISAEPDQECTTTHVYTLDLTNRAE